MVNRIKWIILGFFGCLLMVIAAAALIPGSLIDAVNRLTSRDSITKVETKAPSGRPASGNEMIVLRVQISQLTFEPVVILKEKFGDRYLPIFIGPNEANAIGLALEGINTPRPLAHELLHSVLNTLGATVDFITINDIQNNTYYARIMVNMGGKQLEIDSRPSDAIAIGIRAGAPIYAEEKVLDRAGLKADGDSGTRPTS